MMNNLQFTYEEMINKIIYYHFQQLPTSVRRIKIGICNEVYNVGLIKNDIIVRLNSDIKYLMGSHDHLPQFCKLGIKVPIILAEDFSKNLIPLAYQIQSKIEGQDVGEVIEKMSAQQLKLLAKEIAIIFNKVKLIPTNNQFGVIWGGGDNDLSDSWTQRMKLWIAQSRARGLKTGVMDKAMSIIADQLIEVYQPYFDSVKPVTYYGDISSKNVMILDGKFNGLVDLDGLTQGDPLEAIGRIKLSWYGTKHGRIYTTAIMDELNLNNEQRKIVTLYALLNQISWACENGIQFNQNTTMLVDQIKLKRDRALIAAIKSEL